MGPLRLSVNADHTYHHNHNAQAPPPLPQADSLFSQLVVGSDLFEKKNTAKWLVADADLL
jgi:hypothetical protein